MSLLSPAHALFNNWVQGVVRRVLSNKVLDNNIVVFAYFQHLEETFRTHGLLSLELFSELEEEDLNNLAITSPEDRAKVLTAAQLLLDYDGN